MKLETPADSEMLTWDLTLRRLWPLLDGTRNIAAIGSAARVDVELVCKAVHALQVFFFSLSLTPQCFPYVTLPMPHFPCFLYISSRHETLSLAPHPFPYVTLPMLPLDVTAI